MPYAIKKGIGVDYNEVLQRYDRRFKDNQEIVATFLVDINSKKYVKDLRSITIDEKEIIQIIQNSILSFSNNAVKSLIVETNDLNIVFVRTAEDSNGHLYIIVAKKQLALGALLSIVKSV